MKSFFKKIASIIFILFFAILMLAILGKAIPFFRLPLRVTARLVHLEPAVDHWLGEEPPEAEHHHEADHDHEHSEVEEEEREHFHDEEAEHHHDEEAEHHHDEEAEHHHDEEAEHHHDEEAEHHHEEEDIHHHSANEVAISLTAAKNLGLDESTIVEIQPTDYYKSIRIPAIVTECPDHSMINIPSPLTGTVAKIYHETGVAVSPGDPLFDLTINDQGLIQLQSDYVALLKAQEINQAEITRMSHLTADVEPLKKRELSYERERLAVSIASQRKELEFQGLSVEQIAENLETKREMVGSVTVYAPETGESDPILTLDKLLVRVGQNIVRGEPLCVLTDLEQLVIKGKLFAADEEKMVRARKERLKVDVFFDNGKKREKISDLFIRSIDNRIDPQTGITYCYVDLLNQYELYTAPHDLHDQSDQRRYVQWHFRPGERCTLLVEYEKLPNCFLLPVDAITQDIGEICLFQWVETEENANIWRRVPVHLLYRSKDLVAIANDGAIPPGSKVAGRGASFLLSALTAATLRNAGGGGVQHGDHVH